MDKKKRIDRGTWKKELRLYVHVPFCVRKCYYCDFLSGPSNQEGIDTYFEALYKEINSYKNRGDDYRISSVFIGGGTPSCVDSGKIVRTLEELKNVFEFKKEAEITIEVNPGTVEMDSIADNKLLNYKKAGINRLSFGLQSTIDSELKLLGRIHTYAQFEDNYKLARNLGFNNINIDLMSALPGQNIKTWEEGLVKICKLEPEHISAYSLIIEEGTPFYEMYGPEGRMKDKLPSEEEEGEIYNLTRESLLSAGYQRYEISNYAKQGYECSHNLAYWEVDNYLGLGLGAASLINNQRFHNTYKLEEYLDLILNNNTKLNSLDSTNTNLEYDPFNIRKDIEVLSKNQQMEEFMFLGLRKTKGISKETFYNKFGLSIYEIYGNVLNKLEKQGLITTDDKRIWLTDYGIDISNRVLADFLLD
jgi:oxygen-independent coproporphyrinogen-3 oxidase